MLAKDMNLPSQIEASKLRLTRVLAVKSLEDLLFDYYQGQDRYLIVSYLLSFNFCFRFSLDESFAEAICYFLFEKWINLSNIPMYLCDANQTETIFQNLDQEIEKYCPKISLQIVKNGHSSIHFALSWHLLFFADHYSIFNLLLLWDHIILHQNEIAHYLLCLSIAHVKQFPILVDEVPLVEMIQKYRDYNILSIINEAERLIFPCTLR